MKKFGCEGHVPPATGDRYGHCALCHLDFMGLGAFDKHRRMDGAGRYCVYPPADEGRTPTGRPIADWWVDDRGRWHEGPRSEFWKKEN